jgi:ABC-type antimicrobial peptide transport system permease subunit
MTSLVDVFRSLRRSKGLTLAAVSCIALGSVAATGMATLVDATLLRPLPFPDADRLVRVWLAESSGDSRLSLSIPEAEDGATPRQTAVLLLRGSVAPIAAGAALGSVGAGWAGAALRGLLYDVGRFDPWAFAGALSVLAAVALLAGAVPARRVASVDPLSILRSDET